MTMQQGDEWARLKSDSSGNIMYRGKIFEIIDHAYKKFLEIAGSDELLNCYEVAVEIDDSGKVVEILFALRNIDEPIMSKTDLIEIIGFTFNFDDGRLIDVATVKR
ncbi:hypothetical protein [Pseudoduganella sp. HUAS MS19]